MIPARYATGTDAPQRAEAAARARIEPDATVVLVEGVTDQIAVETVAERLGHRVVGGGVVVLPIGGAHAAPRVMREFAGHRLGGLFDVGETDQIVLALVESGRASPEVGADDLGRLGFGICRRDLEAELLRVLTSVEMEALMEEEGDLDRFRSFQDQGPWRGRPLDAQLHRWLGSQSGRRHRYLRAILTTCAVERFPAPIRLVVDHAWDGGHAT